MEEKRLEIKEFFPLIQQNIRDAYNADCFLLEAPFRDLTIIDRGFRKMVWGQYNTDTKHFFQQERDRIIDERSAIKVVYLISSQII